MFCATSSIGCFYWQWLSLYRRLAWWLCGIHSKQRQLWRACLYNRNEEVSNVYQTWMSYIECFAPRVLQCSDYHAPPSLDVRLVQQLRRSKHFFYHCIPTRAFHLSTRQDWCPWTSDVPGEDEGLESIWHGESFLCGWWAMWVRQDAPDEVYSELA